MMQTIPSAEPFFYPGGSTGCLLVHGFTGTPKEMRGLGQHLARDGHSVLGVRLAGHATTLKDMQRTRKEDWIASVEDGWHLLCGITQRIVVIGLSMGGALAIHAASQLDVAGIALLSTPYYFPDERIRKLRPLVKLLSRIYPTNPKNTGGWYTPMVQEDHVAYPKNPLRQARELDQLLLDNQKILPDLRLPVLVAHSKDDRYVPPDHAEKLYAAIGSPQKELVWTKNCGHVITRDGDTQIIYDRVGQFVAKIALN